MHRDSNGRENQEKRIAYRIRNLNNMDWIAHSVDHAFKFRHSKFSSDFIINKKQRTFFAPNCILSFRPSNVVVQCQEIGVWELFPQSKFEHATSDETCQFTLDRWWHLGTELGTITTGMLVFCCDYVFPQVSSSFPNHRKRWLWILNEEFEAGNQIFVGFQRDRQVYAGGLKL